MNCKTILYKIPLLADNTLPWWQSLRVKSHIKRCPSCREELASYEKISQKVSDAWQEDLNQYKETDLWEKILYKLPKHRQNHVIDKYNAPVSKKLIPALVLSVILLFVFINLNRDHKESHQVDNNQSGQVVYPVIEEINDPNVTIMTYKTDNPDITVVWFFQHDSLKTKGDI